MSLDERLEECLDQIEVRLESAQPPLRFSARLEPDPFKFSPLELEDEDGGLTEEIKDALEEEGIALEDSGIEVPDGDGDTVVVPVDAEVTWLITDQHGRQLSPGRDFAPVGVFADVQAADAGRKRSAGTDTARPKGRPGDLPVDPGDLMQASALDVLFCPQLRTATVESLESTESPEDLVRRISAQVTLSTRIPQGTASKPIPHVDAVVPALPVPPVLALFVESNFDARQGGVLVVTPPGRPLKGVLGGVKNSTVWQQRWRALLETAEQTLRPVEKLSFPSGLGVVGFLLGLNKLLRAIRTAGSAGPLRVRATNSITQLRDVRFKGGLLGTTGATAKDSISSLILLAEPDSAVELFNAPDHSNSEGQLDVTTGQEWIVEIADLHHEDPASRPAGRTEVVEKPQGRRRGQTRRITTFGDELSSINFRVGPDQSQRRSGLGAEEASAPGQATPPSVS